MACIGYGVLGQTPAANRELVEDWRVNARGNALVVKATVLRDGSRYVVDSARRIPRRTEDPEGTQHLWMASPTEYVVGTLVRFRIDEVIKGDGRRGQGDAVDLFLSGPGSPRFRIGEGFLLVLRKPLDLFGEQKARYQDWRGLYGLTVEDIMLGPAATVPFEPDSAYGVAYTAGGDPTWLPIRAETALVVDAIAGDLALGDFQVTLTSPRNGSSVTGVVELSAASLGREMYAVQYQLDGVDLGGEVVQPPYRLSWDTVTADEGNHELRAIGRDATGALGTSGPVSVEVRRMVRLDLPSNAIVLQAVISGNRRR